MKETCSILVPLHEIHRYNCLHSVQVPDSNSQVLSSHDSDPICTEQNGDSNPICTEQNGGPTKIVDPQVTHIPRQRF